MGIIEPIVSIVTLALAILTTIWAYNDAESRGSSGCLVALLVFFVCWPVSLVVWILVRPK
jgi:hypothetical protein